MEMKDESNDMRALGLTRLYIFALSLVAILSIIGQVLIQSSLREGATDAYIVNMAGRQRMLSQKICKGVVLLESETHDSKKAYLQILKRRLIYGKSIIMDFTMGMKNWGSQVGTVKK